jgi:hypothetical protein
MAICPRKDHGGLAGVIVERRWSRGQSPSQMRAHHRSECGRQPTICEPSTSKFVG